MNKFIFCLLIFLTAEVFSQNYNWITPNKQHLKLYVISDGIYRINKSDFINAGVINAGSINPKTIKVYYKGFQIPIFFFGEDDNVFNDNDYLDFYGQRNYGGQTNTYKWQSGSLVVDYTTEEYYNLYSDTSVYWVMWDGENGQRLTTYNFSGSINYPDNFYYESTNVEKDSIYSLGERRNSFDFRELDNEKISGEGWYWREMQRGNSVTANLNLTGFIQNSGNSLIKLFAYPNSFSDSILNEHRLILRVNGSIIDTLKRNDYNRFDTTISVPSSLLSTMNTISFTYTNPGTYLGRLYFDFFRLKYPSLFKFENNKLSFESSYQDSSVRRYKVIGYNPTNDINIYDIKNNKRIINYFSSGDTLFFYGKGNGKFEVLNSYITQKPLRIKTRQVPSLASTSNGADYLIIYNKIFETQAEELRQYRAVKDNFRSVKAEIEDVIDIFNFGIESPSAIRNFTKFVFENWQTPKFKYLCLFGRGSLDPKRILSASQYYQNLIPVYGNPTTDGYFANFSIGSYVYINKVSVGRIPVLTVSEAQNVLDKIKSYESRQPGSYVKNFAMITGGQNIQEQQQFASQSNYLINQFINSKPVTGSAVKIYRNDSTGYVTYNYQDSIKNTINRGVLLANYIGHAASNTWDNGLENPDILSNGDKLALILSMTCFTGKYSEATFRSFGEKFVYLPSKGAIGFIGTTGWSFSGTGNNFNEFLLRALCIDSTRRIGDVLKVGGNILINSLDSSNFAVRNTINSYNLMGDPAAKLLLPLYPEFDIQPNDYELSNQYPALREIITLKIVPKNLGLYADSVKTRYLLFRNNSLYKTRDTVIKDLKFIDTISYAFSLDSSGSYEMKIVLDPENWYPDESKLNNSISFPINLKNILFVPLKPLDNELITSDSLVFCGLNPNISITGSNNIRLMLQIDTSKNFNSSQTYFKDYISGTVTKFSIRFPYRDTGKVYYWRMNAIIAGDSTGWSEKRKFVFGGSKEINSFRNNSTDLIISKRFSEQYETDELLNISMTGVYPKLNEFNGEIIAKSWGLNLFDASYITLNSNQYMLLGSEFAGGLNIAKVNKTTGKLLELRNFKFSTNQANDSVNNFLNTFTENNILIITKAQPYSTNFNINSGLNAKLKFFGSTKIDSVNLLNYNYWSFICYKPQPNAIVSESFSIQPQPAICSYQPDFMYDSGIVIQKFGTSDLWKNINFLTFTPIYSGINSNLFGVGKNNSEILLINNMQSGVNYFLDTISSSNFPYLKLKSVLYIDTLNGVSSPELKSSVCRITPPVELAVDYWSFSKTDSLVEEGDTVTFQIKYGNVGYSVLNKVANIWSVSSPSGIKIIKSDTIQVSLPTDSFLVSTVKVNTLGLRKTQKVTDTVFVFFNSYPVNQNENYTYNNSAVNSIVVKGDTIQPVMDVTYDGIRAMNGDYIQSNPQIVVKIFDNSKVLIKDTSNIKIFLDTLYVPFFINGVKNPILDIIFEQNKILQATVIFRPVLKTGTHMFRFVVYDNNGNFADTVTNYLIVNSKFRIAELMNYPNPMKDGTTFLINLSGNQPPLKSKLKIFTVAGRTVKVIETPLKIGFNQIFWDGKDDDGDYISNGVYLYKLVIEGDMGVETSLQKLVILK